ncbi:MAG: hypothetical protein LW878_04475 [Proteobacteria bacterium]|nr:hypothetical protein [Pseudomonadota bacterium]
MRELKTTKIEGRIYLFPIPVMKDRKYLVLCTTESEAQLIAEEVESGKLQHPDLISEDFVFLTFHSDKQTKIFVVKRPG